MYEISFPDHMVLSNDVRPAQTQKFFVINNIIYLPKQLSKINYSVRNGVVIYTHEDTKSERFSTSGPCG